MLKQLQYFESKEIGPENYSVFRVRREDYPICFNALDWFVGDSLGIPTKGYNINPLTRQNEPLDLDSPVIQWHIPGRFSPVIDENDLAEIVEMYKLLKDFYSSWGDVIRFENKSSDPLENEAMNLMLEQLKGKLPPWAKMVLEVRNEAD